jgi:hypothetical protein
MVLIGGCYSADLIMRLYAHYNLQGCLLPLRELQVKARQVYNFIWRQPRTTKTKDNV